MFKDIYRGKKVLITGNTGFKGSWLTAWLLDLGAVVYGFSIDIPSSPSHFEEARLEEHIHHQVGNILELEKLSAYVKDVQPDFVFHLAAQPLVRYSYDNPILTLQTNIIGTANVLEALRQIKNPCQAVLITSDKCYDNVEWAFGFRETDPLGGKDPYSASKGAAELAIKTYFHSYFHSKDSPIRLAIGRAGNVIGGGDWAQNRIVPDAMSAWSANEVLEVRIPNATRPWQHVLEPLSGYLQLGQSLAESSQLHGEPYNFGPNPNQNFTVIKLVETMGSQWPNSQWVVKAAQTQQAEAGLLKLCCDKALQDLHWSPTLNFEETCSYTVEWYQYYKERGVDHLLDFTKSQIHDYCAQANKLEISWAK